MDENNQWACIPTIVIYEENGDDQKKIIKKSIILLLLSHLNLADKAFKAFAGILINKPKETSKTVITLKILLRNLRNPFRTLSDFSGKISKFARTPVYL